MDRRAFITGLGVVLAAPLAGEAQRSEKVWHIAVVFAALGTTAEMQENHDYKLLMAELRGFGYVEGRNLVVYRRVGEGRSSKYPELAREIAGLRPDVIYAASGPLLRALKDATRTIPIVGVTADFRAGGLVESLARPGANITGFSISPGEEIFSKRIQLLREAVPTVSAVAFLVPRPAWEGRFGDVMRSMVEQLGVAANGATLSDPIQEPEYERAFARLSRDRLQAVVVTDHAENYVNQRVIVRLAAEARLPTIYPFREAVAIGGLMTYSADLSDMHRHVASYIDRILRGDKAADLPIQQPTKFLLGINLKTAKALGLTIPQSILLRADQVIE